MKKRVSVGLSILMVLFMCMAQGVSIADKSSAEATQEESFFEEKFYSRATLEDEFADDRVLLVLNKQETQLFRNNFSARDFVEAGVAEVKELTQAARETLQEQIQTRQADVVPPQETGGMEINEDSFRTILSLTLHTRGKENVLEAIKKLERRSDVLSAEPDYALQLTSENPNDFCFRAGIQWGLNGAFGINAPAAWGITTGSSDIRVGVIDTGIQANHPDLINRMDTNLSRDFILPAPHIPNAVADLNGHGTHVAGIIGAQGNNVIGISGVAQNVRLVSLNVFTGVPTHGGADLYASGVVLAISHATAHKIPILNNSNGNRDYFFSDSTIFALETSIKNYPGLFVTTAGNDNSNNDSAVQIPANYRLPNLISVGAIKQNGDKWEKSNFGARTVDLFAPGDGIISTFPETFFGSTDTQILPGYALTSGTSMAAPHVSGVAALLLSEYPRLTATDLKQIILASVTKDSRLTNLCVSGGRLNAHAALTLAAEWLPPQESYLRETRSSGTYNYLFAMGGQKSIRLIELGLLHSIQITRMPSGTSLGNLTTANPLLNFTVAAGERIRVRIIGLSSRESTYAIMQSPTLVTQNNPSEIFVQGGFRYETTVEYHSGGIDSYVTFLTGGSKTVQQTSPLIMQGGSLLVVLRINPNGTVTRVGDTANINGRVNFTAVAGERYRINPQNALSFAILQSPLQIASFEPRGVTVYPGYSHEISAQFKQNANGSWSGFSIYITFTTGGTKSITLPPVPFSFMLYRINSATGAETVVAPMQGATFTASPMEEFRLHRANSTPLATTATAIIWG
ncbi:MAG: S8 family serine peptidase [Firmicutes bacterium]|nr:S8 family serine peptidase [Bacillota bacterium]